MAYLLWFVFLTIASQTIWGFAINNNLGIYGGHKISIEEAPYMAALVNIKADGNITFCGGSIIHERFVLTAAHCLRDSSNPLFAAGLVGIDDLDDENGTSFKVEEKFCRKDYTPGPFHNDICLLKLREPIKFGSKVAPVKLPNAGLELAEGTLANVTGWGKTETSVSIVNNLRQGTVSIMSDENCLKYYPKITTSTQFCAGSEGHDSCAGDSGGPLIYNNVQIGVVSSGNGCGKADGKVYVRVSSYLEWINKTITENMF